MGIFDRAKDLLNEHQVTVNAGIDKTGDLVDQRTGGQHADQVDAAAETPKENLDELLGEDGNRPERPA